MTEHQLRIIFMGTPDFAVPCLRTLLDTEHDIVGVVSQPNRRVGRGRRMGQTPVAALAELHGSTLYQWPRLNNESYSTLKGLKPDLAVVVAYGKILPQRYLELPRFGCLNVHSSLLPRLRGAGPIQRAVIDGHEKSGVTIMRLDAGMDTGDVAYQSAVDIGPDETAGQLHDRLAELGAHSLMKVITQICDGTVAYAPQNHEAATHAPRLSKEDGLIDWSRSAQQIHNHIRGMAPWPGAFVSHDSGPIKIHESRMSDQQGIPGTILSFDGDGPVIAGTDGSVCLIRLQRPGKRPVTGAEYLRATPLSIGAPFPGSTP
jgi:methionyl-tRNA formyltransferase